MMHYVNCQKSAFCGVHDNFVFENLLCLHDSFLEPTPLALACPTKIDLGPEPLLYSGTTSRIH